MDPIPTSVRRLWDVWNLRGLVLLSFTLQIILSLFGSRRKYIPSVWISVLVWSAYLMADWIATVALGKLLDVQGDPQKKNVLWALWAPLLLLHLGGPDTITAYSLEDNQLWMRHLLGLVIQLFVAIYVILMSWKNSWFSFMSLPALIAGVIKYWERTSVLKFVSEDKYLDRISFLSIEDGSSTEGISFYSIVDRSSTEGHDIVDGSSAEGISFHSIVDGSSTEGHDIVDGSSAEGMSFHSIVDGSSIEGHDIVDGSSTEGHDYVQLLLLAHHHLLAFISYLRAGGARKGYGNQSTPWVTTETNIKWDALEVQMGLVYELLYTKATVIYSKRGFITRCISFGCSVSVLVGLTIQIVLLKTRPREENDEENWHEIDIAITGVLILGAVALEIYATIALFSSNWMMLWLIEQGKKEWVIWLSQRFPWLFNKKKKYWSQMIGQFDLVGYYLKNRVDLTVRETDVQSPSTSGSKKERKESPTGKIIRWMSGPDYEDKWNKYLHKTACSVHPLVYNAILELCDPHIDSRISDSLTSEMDEVWMMLKDRNITGVGFSKLIRTAHLATEICYRLELEWDAGGEDDPSGSDSLSWKQNREVSKVLSDYMMYLVILHPSLLPINVLHPSLFRNEESIGYLEVERDDPGLVIRDARDINAACHNLLMDSRAYQSSWSRIATYLKGKEKAKRWEIIKEMWLRTLCAATRFENGFGQKNTHFQHLRHGGELLTLIWFINPPFNIFLGDKDTTLLSRIREGFFMYSNLNTHQTSFPYPVEHQIQGETDLERGEEENEPQL